MARRRRESHWFLCVDRRQRRQRGCGASRAGEGFTNRLLGRYGQSGVSRVAGRDGAAVGQELAGVVEHDDAIAQQAPPLLRMEGDGVGGVAVRPICRWALGSVWTHRAPPGSAAAAALVAWLLAVCRHLF
jgi:hypothetical protein